MGFSGQSGSDHIVQVMCVVIERHLGTVDPSDLKTTVQKDQGRWKLFEAKEHNTRLLVVTLKKAKQQVFKQMRRIQTGG